MNTATLYNEKKKTIGPKLRFQEFNNEWTKIKLGDLLTFKNGLNSDKEKYGKGIKFINVLDILNNNFITYDKILGSVEVTEKEFEKNEVSYGDILFQRSSETRAEVGQANVYLDRDKSSVFGGFVIRGKAKYEYNPLFMNYLLRTPIARKEITDKSGGSTRYNVGQDTLSQVQLTTTTIFEQQKIASFLSAVDEKIQLLSRKKELLEQYKKGIMQQLLSGKLRFKDENGKDYPDWEEKKLGELGVFKGGGTPSTENLEYWDGEIPWISSSDINDNDVLNINVTRFITNKAIYESATKIIPANSVLFVARVGVGKLAVSKTTICTSQDFTNFIPHEIDPFYLAYYFIKNNNLLISYAQGTSIKGFTSGDLKSIKLSYPVLEEQQKIAAFLSSIDRKIESINKQITKVQIFKKGLLQQMFV